MSWHLKDKEFEKKLNELSNGEFSMNLFKRSDGNFMSCFGEKKAFVKPCVLGKEVTEFHQFVTYFTEDEVEDIPEYDPSNWNEYPKVTPPINVIMRVDFRSSTEGAKAYWDGTDWMRCRSTSCSCDSVIQRDIVRFRPWED